MVHALEEAWRVLAPQGVMMDARPRSVVVPLEVVSDTECQVAGEVDNTPDIKYDIAADSAIASVVNAGKFAQSSYEIFDYIFYWKTYHGMVVDFKERWEGEIIVAQEVLDQARRLYRQYYPYARLRLPMQMMIGKYEKRE